MTVPRRILLPCLLILAACQEATFDDNDVEGTGADEAETGDGDGDTEADADTDGGPTYNCDPDDVQPCPEGQKCTVLGPPSAPTYDCVTDDGFLLPFEACTPSPSNGQDGCPAGFACHPVSAETPDQGLCLQLCAVDANCELAFCAAPRDSQIKVCAAICDPLAPACPETQDCQRIRQAMFVCQFPGPDDNGTQTDACDGNRDAGCAEGFVCQTGPIVPECTETSCCTSLCDLGEPDSCGAPALCGDLDLDPVPGLEDVGACYIPQ
jgi:hypothetical protein